MSLAPFGQSRLLFPGRASLASWVTITAWLESVIWAHWFPFRTLKCLLEARLVQKREIFIVQAPLYELQLTLSAKFEVGRFIPRNQFFIVKFYSQSASTFLTIFDLLNGSPSLSLALTSQTHPDFEAISTIIFACLVLGSWPQVMTFRFSITEFDQANFTFPCHQFYEWLCFHLGLPLPSSLWVLETIS